MSFVLLGILNSQAAGAGAFYYLSVLGGSSSEAGDRLAIDSDGNSYAVGDTESTGAGAQDILFIKYDPNGTVLWQRTLGGSTQDFGYGAAVDSLGNPYLLARTNSTGAGDYDFLLAKYNSSGNIQWQRTLGGSGREYAIDLAIDSSDNLYALGYTESIGAGRADFLVAKYDSDGSLIWQRIIGGTEFDIPEGIGIDSSDNVYLAGATGSSGQGSNDIFLVKYNSSGTVQWQRTLGLSGNENALDVSVDSLGNPVVVGQTFSIGAGGRDTFIAKYNSSGTVQWQRVLGGTGTEYAFSVDTDSSNNIYILGWTDSSGAGGRDFLISKYDPSGTIQWQRTLGTTRNDEGYAIKIDQSDNILILGYANYVAGAIGADLVFSAKLPNDGSLTGTYSLNGADMVYQASSLTSATATFTEATSSLTAATSSLTNSTSSLTSSSASLSDVIVQIG